MFYSMMMTAKLILNWVLVPIIAYAALLVAVSVCSVILILLLPLANTGIPVDIFIQPTYGIVCAFSFVVSGSYIAPNYKIHTSFVLLALGIQLVWQMSEIKDEEYYLTIFLPSVLSGLVAVYYVYHKVKHNKSLQPTDYVGGWV